MSRSARYRYRFYPTEEQARQLARQFGCARYVWNWALAMKKEAFFEKGEKVSYAETDKRLTQLKREPETEWLQEVSSTPLQQAIRHLDKAYTAFFQRDPIKGARPRKDGMPPGFPRFKGKKHQQSATYTYKAFSLKDSGTKGQPLVKLGKHTEPLNIRWSRPLPSAPKTLTVIREPDGHYFISFVVEVNPEPLPKTKRSVGIDLGLTDVVVTSDGWHSGNPKHFRKTEEKLAKAQRRLARKQKGSKNREKARRKVARLQSRVADQRRDFLHQLSTRLVRRYDVLCTESLAVKNMVRNPSLAKSISDAGWGMFVQMLEYKAEWYGKSVVKLDRFFPSSKTCSNCGFVVESLPLDVRRWGCPECSTDHQRDVNAACNIKAAGLVASAYGGEGRPALASVSGALPDELGIHLLQGVE